MTIRVRTRAANLAAVLFAACVAACLVSALPRADAAADEPELNPILIYTGSVIEAGRDPYPFVVTIDCTSGACLLTSQISNLGNVAPLNGPGPIVLDNGFASVQVADIGDACADTLVLGGLFEVSIVGDSLTGVRNASGGPEIDCGGRSVQYNAFETEFSATRTSGDACLLNNNCAQESPAPTATPEPVADLVTPPILTAPPAGLLTPESPSILSALAPVASSLTLSNAVWAAALTVILVIVVALPSHLLNSAVETASDRWAVWWRGRKGKNTTPLAPRSSGWPLAVGAVMVGSIISAFIDPAFGFNLGSVRVVLSIFASFAIDALLGWVVLIWLVKRTNPSATSQFRVVPLMFLLVVAAVVFSRLTGFEPGLILGGVAGVVFGAVVATADKARLALVSLGYSLALAVVGWIVYSVIVATQGADPAAIVVFLRETASALTIGGIVALPIALVPLRGLSGYDVFRWNRWAWGAAYAIGLFGFFLVLMPLPTSWAEVGLSMWTWLAIFVSYAVIATAAWLLLVRPWAETRPD